MMPLTYGYKAEDIVKDNRVSWDEIENIQLWTKTVKIPKLIDEQIVNFLLSCDRDVEFTKKTIIEYFKVRTYAKELFDDRDLENADMQLQLETLEYIALPVRTQDGRALIYHKLHDPTYWKYKMAVSMKLLFMTIDAALYNYPPTGLIIIFDMKGVGLMHLTRINLNNIKAFFHYCQEGLPVKLCAIHVLNSVYFIDKIMTILKPFMKKELYKMLHFHPPSMTCEEFHKKYIDKGCLPFDYGGDLPDTRVLHEENTKTLSGLKPYFDAEEEARRSFFDEEAKS